MQDEKIIDWLLSAETPTIRYLTLRDLLHRPESDSDLQKAYQDIQTSAAVTEILAGQAQDGSWAVEKNFYQPKFFSSHWSMLCLAELRANSETEALQKGARHVLNDTASAMRKRKAANLGWVCLWGNILHYTVPALGVSDEAVQAVLDYVLADLDNGHCRCEYNYGWACAWGVIRALWGLSAIPADQRNPAVQQAINEGVDFLLQQNNLAQVSYPNPDGVKVHSLWHKLSFPLFYQADILFTLRVLASLDALDHPGAQPALDWLISRRTKQGYWRGSSPFRSRTWAGICDPSDTDRWVTLQALQVLERAARRTPGTA